MRILAADLTSFESSLAFHHDGVVIGEERWRGEHNRHQEFFTRMKEALARLDWQVSSVGAFVAGRGPGNFSGMRISLAAFAAMALPHGIPVRAVSSGRAIAARVFHDLPDAREVAVVGDARRDALWCGRFTRPSAGFLPAPVPYERLALAEAVARLAGCPHVASPEASRLSGMLDLHWVRQDLAPSASMISTIAEAELSAGQTGEPTEPIYLHPPVRDLPAAH